VAPAAWSPVYTDITYVSWEISFLNHLLLHSTNKIHVSQSTDSFMKDIQIKDSHESLYHICRYCGCHENTNSCELKSIPIVKVKNSCLWVRLWCIWVVFQCGGCILNANSSFGALSRPSAVLRYCFIWFLIHWNPSATEARTPQLGPRTFLLSNKQC